MSADLYECVIRHLMESLKDCRHRDTSPAYHWQAFKEGVEGLRVLFADSFGDGFEFLGHGPHVVVVAA